MPGNWTLMLNRTDTLEMWSLDVGIYNSADTVVGNTWDAGTVYVDKHVLVGGKIFWDLNEDDTPNSGEGIESVNVSISSESGFSENVTTDEEGTWKLFVPIRENYTVVAEKSGFDTVTYEDGDSSFYVVNDTHESRDFEMSAGLVEVSGKKTFSEIGQAFRATITLYLLMELKDPYYLPWTGNLEDETLSWSAQIQPGNWIVVVEGTDGDENGGGIAIGLLEASVQEGATLDLVMEKGGLISISTTWLTIDSNEFHAGDVADGVDVEIELGEGIAWKFRSMHMVKSK